MAVSVRSVVADVAVKKRGLAGRTQLHIGEPIREYASEIFGSRAVAVDDDREYAAGEMARIFPTRLQFFGTGRIFSVGGGGIWIATVGANHPIQH